MDLVLILAAIAVVEVLVFLLWLHLWKRQHATVITWHDNSMPPVETTLIVLLKPVENRLMPFNISIVSKDTAIKKLAENDQLVWCYLYQLLGQKGGELMNK